MLNYDVIHIQLRKEAKKAAMENRSMEKGNSKLNINQWAEEDRPREKMERLGAEALSDAELLAILVGSGSPKEDAVSLMKRILSDCRNSLNTLGKMTVRDLCRYNGVGPAKAITILAACELGKRRQMETPEERPELSTATRIYNHIHPVMQDLDVEEFWVLYLNQAHRLIKKTRISHGGISEVSVDIRIIMREAVLCNATIVVACHNHPSGNISPSRQDDALTQQLQKACDVMRLHFMDHVIVADGQYYSYHELGRL
jgi:DNA repair protein RadC